MTIREWRGRASAEQTEAYHSLFVNELARTRSPKSQLGIHHRGGATERQLLTTVAEVREPLEGTFSLNLSAIPEFNRAIARFSRRYPMKINADLSQRAVVYSEDLPWVDSPLPGVQRRMLERDGEEVARATSVVRYAPDSSFDPHTHGGGEEFLVLEGVLSDEHGDFGPGMYVRNPPGSRHTPRSAPGCTILVKLRQMDRDDQEQVRIDTRRAPWQPGPVEGASVMPLFERGSEMVALWKLAPGTRLQRHVHAGGEETFVLEGTLEDELGRYPKRAWLRNPPGSWHQPFSQDGCLLYVKTGHLGG